MWHAGKHQARYWTRPQPPHMVRLPSPPLKCILESKACRRQQAASDAIKSISVLLQDHDCVPCRSRPGVGGPERAGCLSSGGGKLTHQIWACLNHSSKKHCCINPCMAPQEYAGQHTP